MAATLLLAAATPAGAVVFDVTKTKDKAFGTAVCDARCTLREAVVEANLSPEDDRIKIPAGIYRLALTGTGENDGLEGDLDVSDDGGRLSVVGKGAGKTVIDGIREDRVVHLLDAQVADPPMRISKLSIRNGRAPDDGGGIRAEAGVDLTILRSTITGNRTTTLGADGGGIELGDSLLLDRSTVARNRSGDDGGGISTNSGGSLSVSQSTISGNIGGSDGNEGDGAGIYAPGASTTVSNSTISGNSSRGPSADGGGIYATGAGSLEITHSTIAFNESSFDGGGMFVSGPSLFVTHSIVAKNEADDDGDNCEGDAPVESATSLENHDECGFSLPNARAGLLPLADNGGFTRTHALKASSDAVGAGTDAAFCSAEDQRGEPRPADHCDLGAYER